MQNQMRISIENGSLILPKIDTSKESSTRYGDNKKALSSHEVATL